MEYEIVTLEKKTVVGLTARTNNTSPDMGAVIGGLWQKFYVDKVYDSICNKRDGKALGIYTDYAGDEKDDYTIMTGCEVSKAEEIPPEAAVKHIPAGKYARFVVKGELHKSVGAFWQKLWQMELDRAFTADFEEYQNSDPEHTEIHIYISLKAEE